MNVALRGRTVLRVAVGRYPHTAALRAGQARSDLFDLDLADIAPITRAFAPMLREGAFDVSEMALGTALQALAYGKRIVLLPVVLSSRHQYGALLCRTESGLSPGALAGCRIGVRAYTQTTGLWLRGILAEEYRVRTQDLRWTTFEGAHVAEYPDPPWVERAPPGSEMLAMLRDGALDAIIVGNEVPDEPWLRPVFADPTAAGAGFVDRHGFVPVNHIAVVSRAVAEMHPDWLPELVRLLGGGTRAAVQPSIDLALRYMADQALLPRPLGSNEAWAGLPEEVA